VIKENNEKIDTPQDMQYTITFNSGGGSNVDEVTDEAGTSVQKPQDPVRPGYIFQGWYSAASGGTKYEWPHTLTGSLTMYAHWQESGEYTITFDSQGGSETSAASGNEGTSISRPQDSVRPGYIFQGWYSAASGGTKYEWPHTLTGSLTMYAHWSGIAYTVEYNANGGTGSTASTGHVYGVESSLAQNGFTRGGYNFAGWNSQVDGLGINYAAGGKVTDLVSEAGGKVTLYARWINDDNLPPMISGTVSIDGDATEGADLSANIDNLGGDGAVSYQWQRGGSVYGDYTAIAGANGRTYTVAADDLGKYIMVMVIRAGYEGAVKSEARGPVGSHFIEGSVIIEYAIEGVDIVDVVLNASIDDLGGDGAVSYQWQTSDFETGPFSNIIGAVYKTYTLVKADLNKWFKVNVTREGYQGSLSSNLFYSGGIVDPTALIWVAPAANTTGISSIKGIAFGNEGVNARFVAVGEGGKAAYSPDGKTWTASGNTGFGNSAITAVAFGNEGVNARFVAVGEGGKAAYSTDGVTWTAVSDTKLGDSKVTSIAFGNEASDVSGRFVAVTADGKAAYSPDGVTWTAVSDTKFDGAEIFCIAFGGEGVNAKFVAVGRFGMAAYSLDGASWTKVSDTKFSGGGSDIITGVSYGGEGVNARFVAVGTSGRAAYSTNGVTWTAVSDAKFDGADIQGITFGNCGNGRFLAVGEGGKTAYSPDGETWTKVNANSALGNSIICAPVYGAGRFVAFDYTRKLTVYSNLQE
jgi:uncharacterized repeat protein (TIGR02543 family)